MDIKEIGNNWLTTAIWKEGSLYYNKDEKEWIRYPYEIVTLRFLYDVTDESINKIKAYLTFGYYGVSQTPDTKVYILVFNKGYIGDYCGKCGNTYEKCQTNHLKDNFINWTSRNVILDAFIQKMQLKLNNYGKIFEWIPYNEFIIIRELENYTTLAMWEKGPLYYNSDDKKLVRKSCEMVYLKYLYNSQEITDEFLNEVELYLEKRVIFGISQNPDKEVYLLVFNDKYFDHYCEKCGSKYENNFNKWCKQCKINQLKNNFTNWTRGNIQLDDFIQKVQLEFYVYYTLFEWIPYNEFIINKESGKYRKHITLAIWEKGLLHYNTNDNNFVRQPCEKVI
ncbi:unnamed protein product [Rhizophagus irregularis]|nr:unnamed protein product [Rhizophagus irregularis]